MGLLLHIGAKNGREKFAIRLGKICAIHIINPQVNTAVAQRISVWATRHKQALASVVAGIKNGFVIGNDLGIAFGKYVAVLRSDGLYVLRREKPSLKVCFDNNLGLCHELLGDESQQRLLVLFDCCDGLRIILLQESGVALKKELSRMLGRSLS